jgi:hypothetical protein
VERHGADLEQQADRHQGGGGEQQVLVAGAVGDRDVDVGELEAAGVAVGQRDAVEEEHRREGAEQEVLERSLLAHQPAAAREAAEQVERQAQDLEGHEHREQVVGRREQHHAREGEQREREHLGVLDAVLDRLGLGGGARRVGGAAGEAAEPTFEAALGEQQHAQEGEDQQDAPGEDAGTVDRQGALGSDRAAREPGAVDDVEVLEDPDRVGERRDDADDRDRGLDHEAGLARPEGLDDHAEDGGTGDDEHRRQQGVLDVRRGDVRQVGRGCEGADHSWPPSCAGDSSIWTGVLGAGSPSPTWLITASIAGLMTLSIGCGKKPRPTIRMIAGVSDAISRWSRSVTPSLPGLSGPVMTRWYMIRM